MFLAVAALGLLLGGAALAHELHQPPGGAASIEGPPGEELPGQAYRSYIGDRDFVLSRGNGLHEFYFTRAIYSSYGRGYGGWRRGSWAVDWPKADIQFLWGLKRLTNIDAYDLDNPVALDDPDLRRYPFLYMLEVGAMQLTPPEVEGLRDYLMAGGFLFVDDFWGTYEWKNFEWEIHKVLPGYEIVELSLDHPLFSNFYVIEEILQIPNVGNARAGYGTWEQDGYVPHVRAIFDDDDRLLVLINWNTDLGDAWEWAEDPWYPLIYSNFAYQMGVNAIIYAMSH
ncbi:MAG: DUF4159 domain-containing protein [Acidobacteria bacterium]|nr:DUF4159 domain-containing protein [Acidobacteriota bacterium]